MNYCNKTVSVNQILYSNEVKYVSGFRYAITDFDLNDHISLRVLLVDQNGQPLEVKMVELGGNDYAKWGNDDNYLLNFIATSLGLTIPIVAQPAMTTPIQAVDTENHKVEFVYLIMDNSHNIILPNGYSRDENNNVLDTKGNTITYEFLKYSAEGIPITFGSLSLDENNNPVLPFGGSVDGNGMARDAQGEHIVMISPSL